MNAHLHDLDTSTVRPILEAAVNALTPDDRAERIDAINRGEFPEGCWTTRTSTYLVVEWGGRLLARIPISQLKAANN